MLRPSYSRRKRLAEKAEGTDVYQYDLIPARLRVQVVHALRAGIGRCESNYIADSRACYAHLVKNLRRELGMHTLIPYPRDDGEEFFNWIECAKDTDEWLDGVELALQLVDRYIRDQWSSFGRVVEHNPDDVIGEINARFLEAGFGYQFVSGEMIRFDNLHAHKEIVIPALRLLREPAFAAAELEYRAAHESYRNGDLENCLVDCAKAFESVLKVIAAKRGWATKETDSAFKLIEAAVREKFLPSFLAAQLNHLKGLLETSTPTIRNKMGGHGAGNTPRIVPRHLASYQLHQTAAAILYLAEQDAALGLQDGG